MGVFFLPCKSLPAYSKTCHNFCRLKGMSYYPPNVGSRTWIERSADHAREDDEDERQHLQIGSQY